MARDTLHTLLRVRRLAVDEARRALAESIRQEQAAERALADATAAIAKETAAATALSAGDAEVEAFAAWLPQGRAAERRAEERVATAGLASAEARTAVALARAAVRATEALIAQREEALLSARQHAEQHALDEVALRPPRP